MPHYTGSRWSPEKAHVLRKWLLCTSCRGEKSAFLAKGQFSSKHLPWVCAWLGRLLPFLAPSALLPCSLGRFSSFLLQLLLPMTSHASFLHCSLHGCISSELPLPCFTQLHGGILSASMTSCCFLTAPRRTSPFLSARPYFKCWLGASYRTSYLAPLTMNYFFQFPSVFLPSFSCHL